VGISALACGNGQLFRIYAVQGYRREESQVLAAVTRSPGEMVVGDVPGPGRARAGHVIVRPERVGICGSDFRVFAGEVGGLARAAEAFEFAMSRPPDAIKIVVTVN
jgi:hypothetical protein